MLQHVSPWCDCPMSSTHRGNSVSRRHWTTVYLQQWLCVCCSMSACDVIVQCLLLTEATQWVGDVGPQCIYNSDCVYVAACQSVMWLSNVFYSLRQLSEQETLDHSVFTTVIVCMLQHVGAWCDCPMSPAHWGNSHSSWHHQNQCWYRRGGPCHSEQV